MEPERVKSICVVQRPGAQTKTFPLCPPPLKVMIPGELEPPHRFSSSRRAEVRAPYFILQTPAPVILPPSAPLCPRSLSFLFITRCSWRSGDLCPPGLAWGGGENWRAVNRDGEWACPPRGVAGEPRRCRINAFKSQSLVYFPEVVAGRRRHQFDPEAPLA